jgi:hypothetical protein
MTSRRTSWDLTENPLSVALEARRARGGEVLDLAESNPTRVSLPYPDAEIRAALSRPGVLSYEPSPKGLPAAREAVAAHHGVDPARVVLTASTSEAYAFLWKLLADPGDEILVPRPSYPLFDYLATLEGIVARPYRLEHDGYWRIDLHSIERAIGTRTRAIVLVHPNNPTGSFVKTNELHAVARFGLPIVSDEVFAEYAFATDPSRAGPAAARGDVLAFTLSGLSKLALLPQVKLGWIVVGGPEGAWQEALARLEVVADTYLSVSASAMHGAARLLEIGGGLREAMRGRLSTNLSRLASLVARAPSTTLLVPEGGWYAIVRLPRTRSDEALCLELLEEDGVHVHPGSFYDLEDAGHVVLSLLPEPDRFAEGVTRLLARASERPVG